MGKVISLCDYRKKKPLTPFEDGYNMRLKVKAGELKASGVKVPFPPGSEDRHNWLDGWHKANRE